MGTDIYGKNPTDAVGEHFHRSKWGWDPLWDMCDDLFPELATRIEVGGYAQYNDGYGLNAVDSEALADALNEAVADGRVAAWVAERDETLASLPKDDCPICDSTGIRTDDPAIQAGQHDKALPPEQAAVSGRKFGWCNGCDGRGWKEPYATWYSVKVNDATEFARFLRACGGFDNRSANEHRKGRWGLRRKPTLAGYARYCRVRNALTGPRALLVYFTIYLYLKLLWLN